MRRIESRHPPHATGDPLLRRIRLRVFPHRRLDRGKVLPVERHLEERSPGGGQVHVRILKSREQKLSARIDLRARFPVTRLQCRKMLKSFFILLLVFGQSKFVRFAPLLLLYPVPVH